MTLMSLGSVLFFFEGPAGSSLSVASRATETLPTASNMQAASIKIARTLAIDPPPRLSWGR
jgi:hypothetical protein